MKAVIIEIKNNKAVALINNYEFVTIKNKGYSAGDRIEITEEEKNYNRTFNVKKLVFAISLILIILTLSFFSYVFYQKNIQTVCQINISVNPEIEIMINQKNIVTKIVAKNQDAKKLELDSLKKLSVDEAVKKYIVLCDEKGYIGNQSTINIDIQEKTYVKDMQHLRNVIFENIDQQLIALEKDASINLTVNYKDENKDSTKGPQKQSDSIINDNSDRDRKPKTKD